MIDKILGILALLVVSIIILGVISYTVTLNVYAYYHATLFELPFVVILDCGILSMLLTFIKMMAWLCRLE